MQHTIKRMTAEYNAVLSAWKDGKIQRPKNGTDAQEWFEAGKQIDASAILGKGRIWPTKYVLQVDSAGGFKADRHSRWPEPADPADILTSTGASALRHPTTLLMVGAYLFVSLILYFLGQYGHCLPALIVAAFVAVFCFVRLSGIFGGAGLMKKQLRSDPLAKAYIAYGVVGAVFASGFSWFIGILLGVAVTAWLANATSLRARRALAPAVFDGTLWKYVALGAGAIIVPILGILGSDLMPPTKDVSLVVNLLYFVPLAILYALGSWMIAAESALGRAIRFHAEMVYWAKTELLKAGKPVNEQNAWQLLTEYRSVALEEFRQDFEREGLLPEFVEAASTFYRRKTAKPGFDPFTANGDASAALVCPMAALFAGAVYLADQAAQKAELTRKVREIKEKHRDENEAEIFTAIHSAKKDDTVRGLDIIQ